MNQVYAQYAYRSEYEGLPQTFGGFAIVSGSIEERPAVRIKQRNKGGGATRYFWDLPGGRVDTLDLSLEVATLRELREEVGLYGVITAKIGQPLWLPIKDAKGMIEKVDCAQAFLVKAEGEPICIEESLNTALVHEDSYEGFKIVGLSTDTRTFGRMPIMIFDGLSVIREPAYTVTVASEFGQQIINSVGGEALARKAGYFPFDGGRYLGFIGAPKTALGEPLLHLFRRLNPFEEGGHFKGSFDSILL